MSKTMKILLIIALCITLVGAAISAVCFASAGFSFSRLSAKSEKVRFEESYSPADISGILIDSENGAIIAEKSPDGMIHVSCEHLESVAFSCGIENGELKIGLGDISADWAWQLKNGFFSSWTGYAAAVTVQIPENSGLNIRAESDNGKITLKNLGEVGSVEGKSDNGEVTVDTLTAQSVTLRTSNGKVSAANVACAGIFTASTDNGSVHIDRLDCRDIELETDNGKISGTVVGEETDYRIETHSDNGSVHPKPNDRGEYLLRAESDNGDINIAFVK